MFELFQIYNSENVKSTENGPVELVPELKTVANGSL